MNSQITRTAQVLFTLLLMVSLVASPLTIPLSANAFGDGSGTAGGEGGGGSTGSAGQGEGSDSESDTEGAEADTDGDGTSDTAEQEAADAAADTVSAAAEAAGLTGVEIDSVDTTQNPNNAGTQVSVDGVEMGVEAATHAVEALGAAAKAGVAVNEQDTLTGHANGSLGPGEVVGANSGSRGSVDEVGRDETSFDALAGGIGAKGARDPNAAPDAISVSTVSIDPNSYSYDPGVSTVPGSNISEALKDAYTAAATSLGKAGLSNLAGKGSVSQRTGDAFDVATDITGALGNDRSSLSDISGTGVDASGKSTTNNTGASRGLGDTTANTNVTPGSSGYVDDAATTYSGPKGVPSQGLNTAAQAASTNVDTYSYSPSPDIDTRGGWTDQNGRSINESNLDEATKGALNEIGKEIEAGIKAGNSQAASYNAKSDSFTVTDTQTGQSTTVSSIEAYGRATAGQQFGQSYSGPKGAGKLNDAARYAAVVAANQNPSPVSSTNPQRDAAIMAALGMAEDPDPQLAMESIANRAIARAKSIEQIAASREYQPVGDRARAICGCKNPSQSNLNQALNDIVSAQSTKPGFATNVTIAEGLINGTAVRSGLTSNNIGYVDFANVGLTISQGRASRATIDAVTAMKADPNSTTLREGKYNEQTFGIRSGSQAPGFGPEKDTFNAYADLGSVANNATTYSGSSANSGTAAGSGNNAADAAAAGGAAGSTIGSVVAGPVGSVVGGAIGRAAGGLLGGIFGGSSTGPSNNTERGSSETINECLYPINCSGNSQAGLAILGFSNLLNNLSQWFTSFMSKDSQVATTLTTVGTSTPTYITVLITVNQQTREIEINRPDINASLENPAAYYTEEQYNEVKRLLQETPFIFASDGTVAYSNGLYSPPVQNGQLVDEDAPRYVYLVEYLDENGDKIVIDDSTNANSTIARQLINYILGASSPFQIKNVASVTYRFVNPNTVVDGDEYYDYVITLNSGETRAVAIPLYSSIATMTKLFGQTGYQGSPIELLSIATETTEEPGQGIISELFDMANSAVTSLFKGTADQTATSTSQIFADLTASTPSGDYTTKDIEKVFIYPEAAVQCYSDAPGYTDGFMYIATVRDKQDPNYLYLITDGRCGQGSTAAQISEVANQLASTYGIADISYQSIFNKAYIRPDETTLYQGITRVYSPQPASPTETTDTTSTGDTTDSGTDTADTSTSTLPNLTNTVVFEIKVTNSSGGVVTDWTDASSVTIGSTDNIYFRWDAADYQQCLPFLNDSGHYSLTRENQALTSGNTESEGYNLAERSATYRIECGGQRNNEFGVDQRAIEVTVR